MKNKILLILTGGTIGSTSRNNIIDIDSYAGWRLLEDYGNLPSRKEIAFGIHKPLDILSENLTPCDWISLIDFIHSQHLDDYSGIIVTHGTDTLPYTSAILSYIFNGLRVPLVVVSSNSPLGSQVSNGLSNFSAAVDFITSAAVPGVFVTYQDSAGENKVHLGTRLTEALPFTHQFRSQKDAHFGEMVGGELIINKSAYTPSIDMVVNRKTFAYDSPSLSDQILLIRPYPGLDYSLLNFAIRPKAILHGLYHSGTACVHPSNESARFSFLNFARKCESEDIDLYVTASSTSSARYASSEKFTDNVIHMSDMSTESALAKLSIAYGSFTDKNAIKKFIEKDIFFEHIRA